MKTPQTLALVAVLLGAGMAHAQGTDTDGDGVPDISEPLLRTDPQNPDTDGDGQTDLADDAPVVAPDPTIAGGQPAVFHIGELLVENNVDPVAHKDAPDHLEVQVVNDGSADVTGLTMYYTLTDQESGTTEAYVVHPDLVVPSGGDLRIHVDDSGTPGHIRANPNSIYVTSLAGKDVSVTLQADGFAPVTATVTKDPGGAEEAD